MKKRGKKEKKEITMKSKNLSIIIAIILSIICFVSFLFIAYSIYLINGIETELRYIGIGVLLLISIALSYFIIRFSRKKYFKRFIIFSIIMLLFIGIQAYGGYFIYKTYSSINNINKNELVYSTSIVTKKDSKITSESDLKGKKVGIVTEDKTSIDNYILGLEIIKDLNLNSNATVVEYENINSLIKNLYDGKIDAMIVTSSYIDMFKAMEGYEDIKEDTKTIKVLERTYTKDEITKITGEQFENITTSAAITKPFTVLVMGVDSTLENLSASQTGNGDALMLVTFNPKTLNATIISIPRDTYTYLPNFGSENKITHAAWGGTNCIIGAVEKLLNVKVNYYVKINFKGVVKLVNALGGVTIDVPTDMCTSDSSRKTNICLKKGTQKLNGEQALAFSRNRYAFATGDFQRGLNQQAVVQAMLNELKTITSANKALEVLDIVSKSMNTNFTTKQLLSFYDIAKNLFKTTTVGNIINIQQLYISGVTQSIYDERAQMILSNVIPNQCSISEVTAIMKQNLGEKSITTTKKMDFDIEDVYSMKIFGTNPSCGTKRYTLIPDIVGKSESAATSALQSVGLKVIVITEELSQSQSSYYGRVIKMSYPAYKRVDKTNGSITITVGKAKEVIIDNNDDDDDSDEPITPGDDNTNTSGNTSGDDNTNTSGNTSGNDNTNTSDGNETIE